MSPSADLVYRALCTLGTSTPEELAAALELPGRRVREALEELREAGGCDVDGSPMCRWRPAAPGAVVVALRQRHQRLAVARHALRHRIVRLGGFAVDEHEPAAREGGIRPLFGSAQVRARLGDLVAAERCEHLAMVPEPAFDHHTVQAAAPLNRELVKRGVRVFSLGVPPAVEDRSGAHTQELIAGGMQYRELPALPTKLMIIDRTTAIMPIDPDNPGKGAWEITVPALVHRLLELYLQHWNQGTAPQKRWTPPMTLTPRERAVLALLAEGHTDETVAAHLGLSRRTIAYTVADLMERHGARNRFQLGLFLSDLGGPADDTAPEPLDRTEYQE
jgi:DNA-binding CsgD family transcriptional regulator/sugar-specific transcriptional regulator TrmB